MRFQFMNAFFKYIRADRILYAGFLISSVFILLTIAATLLFYRSLPPFIPLYNQLPWGESRLGTRIEIFIPSFMGILIFGANIILSSLFYSKIPLVARIFSITSLLVSLFLLLFIIRLIQLMV